MSRTRLATVLLLSAALLVRAAPGFSAEAGITGLVVDGAGKPVPGAEVRAASGGILAGLPDERGEAQRTRAGASGRFRLSLAPGTYHLAASHPGYAPALLSVSLSAGESPEVGLVLGKSYSVTGRITDAVGRPVRGAEVELTRFPRDLDRWSQSSAPDQGLYRARTDAAGHFEVRDLPATWLDLRVEHPDFVPLKREGIVVEAGTGRLDLGRLSLKAGRTVAGIVVDDKGLPLAGTAIWVRVDARSAAEDNAFRQRGPRQVTGPDGRFAIPHLPENEGFLLYACRHDRSQFQQDLDPPLAEPLRIVLPSSGRLPGRIVDPDGHPVPGAYVGALLAGFVPSDLVDLGDPCPWLAQNPSAVTDAAGSFVLEPIAAGTFEVWATTGGSPEYRQKWVAVGGEEGLRRLDVVLQRGKAASRQGPAATGAPASRTAAPVSGSGRVEIHGRVVGPHGEPIAGALIDARGRQNLFTGLDGSFAAALDEEPGGGVTLAAWKDGYAESEIRARPGKEAVIRLERAITLTGRILGLDPEEISQASVTAQGYPGATPRSIVYPDGTYRVADLGPGEWTVTARTRQRAVTGKVTFQPGQRSATLDFPLPDRFPVGGRVLGPDGEGVAGARIRIDVDEIRSREDGSFEIQLMNGSYEITAMGPGDAAGGLAEARLPQPVVVEDAPVEGIEVQLSKGLVLQGCIPGLLPGETPSIQVSNGKTGHIPVIGPDGCYRVSDLGPGDWTLTAELRDVYPGGEEREIERLLALSPDVPETTLDLDFSLGSRTLTVHPAGAGKPGDLSMKLLLPDGTSLIESMAPGEDGAFHVGRLREGSYRVQIRDDQGQLRLDEPTDLSTDRDLVVEAP